MRSVKLPDTIYRDDTVFVTAKCLRPLTFKRIPSLLTMGVFDGVIIVDPTEEEELLVHAIVLCAIDEKSNVCYFYNVSLLLLELLLYLDCTAAGNMYIIMNFCGQNTSKGHLNDETMRRALAVAASMAEKTRMTMNWGEMANA